MIYAIFRAMHALSRTSRCVLLATITLRLVVQADQTVFTDSLQNGWVDYSWATVNLANTSPVHTGADSVSVSSAGYQALYLHHTALNGTLYSSLTFWVNGGNAGGQSVRVQATRNGDPQTNIVVILAPLPVNSWRQETIPLSSLEVASAPDFDGFWLQVQSGGTAPAFYVDDISLVTNPNPPPGITLTAPPNGGIYLAPTNLGLAATVVSNAHTINKVQFYDSSTLLGEDAAPPYSFTWNNVPVGSHTLTARVVFDLGSGTAGTNTSASISITVTTNTPVTITVDASANRHAISPLIYGVAFASPASQLCRSERSGSSLGRQHRNPLQLAAQRPQPRERLVFRKP